MKGYFRKRGNKWYFTIDIGKDLKTGRRKQKSKGGFKTKKEAQEEASRLYYELTSGTYINETKVTFKHFATEWLKQYQHNVKPSTYYNAENQIKRLFREIADIEIQKITPKTYQDVIHSFSKDYSPNSIKGTHAIAKMIFKEAYKQEVIKRDPTKFATLPRIEHVTHFNFMESNERERFLKQAKDRSLLHDYELFHLMMHTGIRLGEALALKWDCVNLEDKTIEIKRTVYNPTNNRLKNQLVSPKTKTSQRVIDLDTYTVNILQEYHKNQMEWKMLNRKFYHDEDFVFPKKYGFPECHTVIQYRFKRLCKLAGIEKNLRPHHLRHTHTVMLLEMGLDIKYIQRRLGHSNINTTLNIYSHVSNRISKRSMSEIEKNVVKM